VCNLPHKAARTACVPVEVVPGISAANGAAAASGIALTHRDASSIVSFVAGQCKGLAQQDWSGLAGKGRTLVIYMGVSTAAQIADKLMADGLAPDMPVAVIENAARSEMRVLRGLLAGLPELVAREAVVSPALIVIGEVTARLSRHPDESQDRVEVRALLAAVPGQARDDGVSDQ